MPLLKFWNLLLWKKTALTINPAWNIRRCGIYLIKLIFYKKPFEISNKHSLSWGMRIFGFLITAVLKLKFLFYHWNFFYSRKMFLIMAVVIRQLLAEIKLKKEKMSRATVTPVFSLLPISFLNFFNAPSNLQILDLPNKLVCLIKSNRYFSYLIIYKL